LIIFVAHDWMMILRSSLWHTELKNAQLTVQKISQSIGAPPGWMWSLVVGLVICLAAVAGILINLYVLLAILLAKQVGLVAGRAGIIPSIHKTVLTSKQVIFLMMRLRSIF
jgi:hypothetical protein